MHYHLVFWLNLISQWWYFYHMIINYSLNVQTLRHTHYRMQRYLFSDWSPYVLLLLLSAYKSHQAAWNQNTGPALTFRDIRWNNWIHTRRRNTTGETQVKQYANREEKKRKVRVKERERTEWRRQSKGGKTWWEMRDDNSLGPSGGLMCEASLQSSIINPIG